MTSEVVKTKRPGMIVLEDLNVSGMAKNHYLAAAILDASFGEIRRQLGYKAKWYGSEVMIADRWYASSKLCSCCGSKRESLPLSERVFRCPECGLVLDRDLNASCNLRSYGLEYRKSCGNLRARRLEVATAQAVVPVVESRMDAALTDAALVVSVKER